MVLQWCLIAFYLYSLFTTDFVEKSTKPLWAVVIFLGNIISMPIFWYLYMWKPARDK